MWGQRAVYKATGVGLWWRENRYAMHRAHVDLALRELLEGATIKLARELGPRGAAAR